MLLGSEGIDDGRDLNDLILGVHPSLTERVQPPSVHPPLHVDRKRVVAPRSDQGDLAEGESLGSETVDLATLDDASTELVLLPVAPDVDSPVDGEGEDVIGPAGDLGEEDGAERRKGDGRELELRGALDAVESEEPFRRLRRGEAEVESAFLPPAAREEEKQLTRKEPQALTLPSLSTATLIESPAAARTARKPSSTREEMTIGSVSRTSASIVWVGSEGSGTFAVRRPREALSLTPQDQTWTMTIRRRIRGE